MFARSIELAKSRGFLKHRRKLRADPDSQLITAVNLLPGNAHDSEKLLERM